MRLECTEASQVIRLTRGRTLYCATSDRAELRSRMRIKLHRIEAKMVPKSRFYLFKVFWFDYLRGCEGIKTER